MGIKLRWYDRWLKGSKSVEALKSHVKVFVMGIDQWKDEEDWPLPQTDYQAFYLHSHANTLNGDGTLDKCQPLKESNDSFVYDPMNPMPSLGGQVILPGENAMGPRDQRQVELREDVLVYTSEILEQDLEVIGPIRIKLYASFCSLDTDFTAKLVDVYPDGRPDDSNRWNHKSTIS